jgi:hypothetical protein
MLLRHRRGGGDARLRSADRGGKYLRSHGRPPRQESLEQLNYLLDGDEVVQGELLGGRGLRSI